MPNDRLNKRRRPLIIACACIAVLLGGGIYTVKLMFTEDLYLRRGTYAYYITIHSPTVKAFPQIKRISDEEYYYSCGDGPKQMANGVNYLTEEEPQSLSSALDVYLKGRGFVKDERRSSDYEYYYKGADSSFELKITPGENGSHRVSGVEYYAR